jgi:hypothetical protein
MRKLIKFGHTLGAIGLLGAMASLLIIQSQTPAPFDAPEDYLLLREVMDRIARWLLLPSLALTVVSGLGSMMIVRVYQGAGWAWLKVGTGIAMFEGSLMAIQGPIQREARLARDIVLGDGNLALLGATEERVAMALWFLGALAVANVALAVFRPVISRWRFFRVSAD